MRNCDKYKDLNEAREAYNKFVEDMSKKGYEFSQIEDIEEWLYEE